MNGNTYTTASGAGDKWPPCSLESVIRSVGEFPPLGRTPLVEAIMLSNKTPAEQLATFRQSASAAGVRVWTSPLLPKGEAVILRPPRLLPREPQVYAGPLRGWVQMENCGPKHAEWKLVKLESGKRVIVDQDVKIVDPDSEGMLASVLRLAGDMARRMQREAERRELTP